MNHDTGTPLTVDVAGGKLACRSWGPDDGQLVVAVHGITANAVSWALVGTAVAQRGLRLVAPDLRGRGDSCALGGASIGKHAEDVWRIADVLGHAEATLVGHSMGGFVVAVAATRRPERTRSVLLVDGGPPLTPEPVPEDQVEAILAAVIGPALSRLDQTFSDSEAYRAFWAGHPAVQAGTPDWLRIAYADHDSAAVADGVRCRVVRNEVIADARDTLIDAEVLTAVQRLTVPARMLVAARGFTDGPDPLYPDAAVAAILQHSPNLTVTRVADTNHYTITVAHVGADAVAQAISDITAG